MASLPTLVPTADVAVGTWTDNVGLGVLLFSKIDETIAAANDTLDFIKSATNPTGSPAITFDITDTPADFLAITTLSVRVRTARLNAGGNDTMGLQARVESSAGVTWTDTLSFSIPTGVTFANSAVTAFTVNATGLAASKSGWDGARLRLIATQTSVGGADGNAVVVSTVELTGTYVASVAATLAAPLGGLTGSAFAAVVRDAVLVAPLGALSSTATATPDHPAALAASLGGLSAGATATPDHPATLAGALGALTGIAAAGVEHPAVFDASFGGLSASGTATPDHRAVFDTLLGDLVSAATADTEHPAVLAAPLGELAATATADIEHPSVLVAPLGVLSASATATVDHPAVSAVLDAQLGVLTASAIATVTPGVPLPPSSAPQVGGGAEARHVTYQAPTPLAKFGRVRTATISRGRAAGTTTRAVTVVELAKSNATADGRKAAAGSASGVARIKIRTIRGHAAGTARTVGALAARGAASGERHAQASLSGSTTMVAAVAGRADPWAQRRADEDLILLLAD